MMPCLLLAFRLAPGDRYGDGFQGKATILGVNAKEVVAAVLSAS